MAITASGLFGLTIEKCFNNGAAIDLESELNKVAMVTDSSAPNFDTHDFWADLSGDEVSGTGYTSGGKAYTGTELTLSGGTLTYDATDVAWTSSTITSAMAAVGYADEVASDPLIFLSDFVTAASTVSGTFTIQWNASGIWTLDFSP